MTSTWMILPTSLARSQRVSAPKVPKAQLVMHWRIGVFRRQLERSWYMPPYVILKISVADTVRDLKPGVLAPASRASIPMPWYGDRAS